MSELEKTAASSPDTATEDMITQKNSFLHSLSSPLTSLPRGHRFALAATLLSTVASLVVTWASVISYPAIFFTGALGTGQLAGFTFCYLSLWFPVYLKVFVGGAQAVGEPLHTASLAAAEFAAYMLLFFFCDRTTVVPRSSKTPDRTTFWTLWGLLIVAALFTLRRAKAPTPKATVEDPPITEGDTPAGATHHHQSVVAANENFHVKHLQRDQTEEWKGWMQVMFLWYHYFNATEIYNVIRLYIAAYVWMTGFGNFSYYYIKKDFSFSRFFQMQWRLNFMVTWVCAILGNEYMLYYICMLHTLFTMMIYGGLSIYSHINQTPRGVAIKVAVLGCVCFVMWDVKGVFEVVWAPLTWLVQYHDPYKPGRGILTEWEFRSFLDHYVWIVGMLCAYFHPNIDGWLERIDQLPAAKSNAIKGVVVGITLIIGYVYTTNVFLLPKKEYNKIHPYTSFIPILLFIVLRNIFTRLRQYHLHLFEFLGKTTLETYIAQFHIWMATTGINGSPKKLLKIIPGDHPLINFVVMSAIFTFVSYRLFQNTNTLKSFVLPNKVPDEVLQRNIVIVVVAVVGVYLGCSMLPHDSDMLGVGVAGSGEMVAKAQS